MRASSRKASGAVHFNIDNALRRRSCSYVKSWLLLPFGAAFVALASFSTNPPPALPLTSSSPGCVRVGTAICKRRDTAASAVATQRTTIASSARIFLDPSIGFLASASLVGRASTLQTSRTQRAAPFSSLWTAVCCRSSPCATLGRRPGRGRRRASCG